MESTIEETAVLLGLAEVKAPFKNLSVDERISIVHICYRKLLHVEFPEGNPSLEDNVKCIGVVDSFYALQEVKLSVKSDGECFLYRKSEVILRHNLKDIIVAIPASDYLSRIIIVSRTQNFGRTLLVLQLQSKQTVKRLVAKLTSGNHYDNDARRNATKSNGMFRRGADSLGRVVGKKVNDLLSSIGTTDKGNDLNIESAISADEASVCPAADEDDDDEANSDSEQEDSSDSVAVKSVIINSLYEPRSSFDRNLLSPLEAEIQYLIQSETGFVDILKRLLDCKLRLQENSSTINKKHSDIMFLCVEELYALHKDLLENIKHSGANLKCICQAYNEKLENFRYHIHYIGNISAAEKIYTTHQEAFNKIDLHLAEDLRKPRMRLNHYVLTFDSLKKICNEDDVSLLQNIILMFKEYLKEADTRLVTDSVVPCPIYLMDYGYLILNGELSLRKGEGLAKKHYHVLLLEQLLVLTSCSQESNEFVAGFLLKDTVLMHELRGVIIHLKVKNNRGKSVLLILKAKSVKLQQKWIEKLKIQIDLAQPKSKTLERQMCIKRKSVDLINNLNIMILNTKEEFIMPPITMEMAFKNIYQNFQRKYSKLNLSLCMREIQETEKLLIKNMEHLLGQKVDCNMTKLNNIKELYEFHLRYLHPAITFEKMNFDIHVVNSIAKHSTNFIKYNECMLYHAAVSMYEGKDSQLIPVFNIFLDNFFKYRIYLCNLSLNSKDFIKLNFKDFQVLFETIKINLGLCLKYTYIQNIPSPLDEKIIMEGFLSVRECLGDVEKDMYLIVTFISTYFLTFTKESININATFKNEHGKFGQPTGLKTFQVKFSTPGQLKKKFDLTAVDVDLKNQWVKCFRLVLPRDIRIRRRAKSEERLSRGKLYSSVSAGQVSSSTKLKLQRHFMESHL